MKKAAQDFFKLYIDATPLGENRTTGIPHFLGELIKGLENNPAHGKNFQIVLLMPYDKVSKLKRWGYKKVEIFKIPMPMRLFNLLWKYNFLPPLDLFAGRGVYLFPNYKNLPLLKSDSLTYIHDLGYVRYPEFVQPKNLVFLKKGIPRWLKRTDRILTGSNHAKKEITKLLNLPAEKVTVIYHGVEHENYNKKDEADIEKIKAKYSIQGKYIICIGSFEPRKNIQTLVRAYMKLPEDIRSQYSLCLVGDGGWLNEKIFKEIEEARGRGGNIVQPSAYVLDEDLPFLISGATLLVHPAIYEGFGLSPLQAMACRIPVAVSDNSSLPEVVGKAGLLFDAKDADDMSDKIKAILSSSQLVHLLSIKGLAQSRKFSWEKTASDLLVCIQEMRKRNG